MHHILQIINKHMNKTSVFFIILGCMAGSLLSSCEHVISKKVIFKEFVFDKKYPLTEIARKPNCKVDIEIDYAVVPTEVAPIINAEIIKEIFDMEHITLQEAADSFAREYVANYRAEMMPILEYELQHNDKLPDWLDFEYDIRAKEKESINGITSYEIEYEHYEGNIDPTLATYELNFRVDNGQRITLEDIFIPEYEDELLELLMQSLLDEYDCHTKEQLQEQGLLLLTDLFITTNFRIDEWDVKFVYNPSEIGAAELGVIELEIPYAEVKHLIKTTN